MGVKVANNAASTIVGGISSVGTTVTVVAGAGALFPALSAGDYFYATLANIAGMREIVKVTARVGDVMTLVRSQEGTLAQAFPVGSRFELRVTAASVTDMIAEIGTTGSVVPPGEEVTQSLQEKIDEIRVAGGGKLKLSPATTYGITQPLVIDSARVGIEGNAATISARYLVWQNPETQPELLVNGDMSNSTPSALNPLAYTGWLIGNTIGTTAAFGGASPVAAFTSGGVQMDFGPNGSTWNAVVNGTRYLEVGQQITAAVGQLIRVTITVEWVRSVIVTNATGETTQASLNVFMGAPRGTDGSSRVLSTMVVASHPSITARKSDFYDTSNNYLGQKTYTMDYLVGSAQFVNPFVRIQSNASARVLALSCKVLPANSALVFTSPGPDTSGHNLHQINGFKIAGHDPVIEGQQIDAISMNSAVPLSTRTMVGNLQILGSGFRYGVEMGHGTYLCSFTDSYITGGVAGLHTKPDSVDSGENINIRGGVFFSPYGIAIWNEGNFQINAFGMSSDFPRQWFKGTGQNRFVACHFEKNGFQGQEDLNLPMIHVDGGQFDVLSGRLQVNQGYFTALRAPFLVEAPGVATFENVNMSNMESTQDVLSVGGGRVRCRGTIGGAGIPTLVHRNYDDNLVPDGRCANTVIDPLTWLTPISPTKTGTYTFSGTTVTCNITNHGLTGAAQATLDFTTGDATDGTYSATIINVNTFTVTLAVAPTSSGSVRLRGADNFARARVGPNVLQWRTLPTAFTGTLTVGSDIITAQDATNSLGSGFAVEGDGIPPGTVIEAWNSTGTAGALPAYTIKMTARATQAGVKVLTWSNPAVTNTAESVLDPTVTRTDYESVVGGGSIKVTKGTGLGNVNRLYLNRLVRLEPDSSIGVEWFMRREAEPGAAANSSTNIFIRPHWSASYGFDDDGVPVLLRDERAGFINESSGLFNGIEDTITFDRQTGRARWDFTANTTNGSKILTSLTASLYSPFNRLEVGDLITGTGIPPNTTVAAKIQRRTPRVGTYTYSGTTVTCNITAHGLPLTGHPQTRQAAMEFIKSSDLASGSASTTGVYIATVLDVNTFTVTLPVAPTENGTVRLSIPRNSTIIQEIRLSNAATASAEDVVMIGIAAAPWARWAWSNLNAPNPMKRPDWATHLRIQVDMSNQAGPRSFWFTDCMATPW